MDPPKIEVEDVSDDDMVPPLYESEDSDSDNSDDEDGDIHPLRRTNRDSPKGSYVNSEGLRHYNRDHQKPTYTIVTGNLGFIMARGP